jgi:hypothetical protein
VSFPDGAEIRFPDDGVTLGLGVNARRASSMTITISTKTTSAARLKTTPLRGGRTLRYAKHVSDPSTDDIGSGGPEAGIAGVLSLKNGVSFDISCWTQSEDPDPLWCVRYLQTLRPAGDQTCNRLDES